MKQTQIQNAAVVGLQWGDEGKGKVVDLLTEQYDFVVRYNGGANAGHSVVVGGQRYALHLIPSGILYPGKTNVIGNGVVIDPAVLLKEVDGLRQRGVRVDDNLRISDRAHVVMPYHRLQDALLEAAVSAAQGEKKMIGTTGRGIGPCYADKASRSTAIRVGDLYHAERFREKLRYIVTIKNATLQALADLSGQPFQPFDAQALAEEYLAYANALQPHVCDTTHLLHQARDAGRKILFEGANACMLDIDHGTYPYVTSSNCSSLGIYAGTSLPGGTAREIVGIMKAYSTRVGGGPFPTELDNPIGQRIRDRGHEYGTTTGRPRRCGWLDLMVVKYAARISGVTSLAVMLLDVLAGFDELSICTGYRYQGKELEAFPADVNVLEAIEPICQTIPGFSEEITGCTQYDALPEAAQRYIELVEKIVGVPVRIVSVGPDRAQTLYRTPVAQPAGNH